MTLKEMQAAISRHADDKFFGPGITCGYSKIAAREYCTETLCLNMNCSKHPDFEED